MKHMDVCHELYFVFKQSLFNLYYTIFNASVYKRDKRSVFFVPDNLPIPPIYPIHGFFDYLSNARFAEQLEEWWGRFVEQQQV